MRLASKHLRAFSLVERKEWILGKFADSISCFLVPLKAYSDFYCNFSCFIYEILAFWILKILNNFYLNKTAARLFPLGIFSHSSTLETI